MLTSKSTQLSIFKVSIQYSDKNMKKRNLQDLSLNHILNLFLHRQMQGNFQSGIIAHAEKHFFN